MTRTYGSTRRAGLLAAPLVVFACLAAACASGELPPRAADDPANPAAAEAPVAPRLSRAPADAGGAR